MLWPPSYFFRRSAASLSRSAPVMRLPFLSSATCSSVSLKQLRTRKDLLQTDLHLPRVTRATRMDGPVATVRFVSPPEKVASPDPEPHPGAGTGRHPEARRELNELAAWLVLVAAGFGLTGVAALVGARLGSSGAPFT